jgi:glucose/arabinose dehydrogenase
VIAPATLSSALAVCALALVCSAQEAPSEPVLAPRSLVEAEQQYYTVWQIPTPEGEVLEVGGLDWLPDGRLAVSTRRGRVWLVEDALSESPRFQLFAEGLQEGLGLNSVAVPDGRGGTRNGLFVVQRGEVTELIDADNDGRAETWRVVSDDWGLSGNYHEFAFGLPDDRDGKLYVSLNVGFLEPEWWLGRSVAPYRGWILQVDPVSGQTVPIASGLRSPCGLGFNAAGDLFVTDNQGDWMATCPIHHVRKGSFYGHPASLDWTDAYHRQDAHASLIQPPSEPRQPAAVWLPYKWSRSAGSLLPDLTAGRFGPFEEQLFLAELTNGMILRVMLEKVRGEYQGAVIPFRHQVGSAVRLLFADDGTLLAGLTNRGWGGLAPAAGLTAIRWTGKVPLEMHSVHLLQDGFEIGFTLPLARDLALTPDDVTLTQYDYDYWWEYGSPERHTTVVDVTDVSLSRDRRTLTVTSAGLTPAMVARLTLRGARTDDGTALLHDEFAYTINQLPEGPLTLENVVKQVEPPPSRTAGKEGWLRLSYGDALDAWHSDGWALVDTDLDPDDRRAFKVRPGVNALVNVEHGPAGDYVSRFAFGDGVYHVEFMLPEGGRSSVYVQARYGIELVDDTFGVPEGLHGTGTIMAAADGSRDALQPEFDGYTGAGSWHVLDITFRAPRFAADGTQLSNAIFEQVLLDKVLMHSDVEFSGPTLGGRSGAAPLAPLVIGGMSGPIALRTLEFFPHADSQSQPGWVPMFDGETLSGWSSGPDAPDDPDLGGWEMDEGELVGYGPLHHLFSPRDDYVDVSVRASVRIGDGGTGSLFIRAPFGAGIPGGYQVQLSGSSADPLTTGSVVGLSPVTVQLIPPGTLFDVEVSCRDERGGTRITVAINGVVVSDVLDSERRHERGHIVLQQHHDGALIRLTEVEVREG